MIVLVKEMPTDHGSEETLGAIHVRNAVAGAGHFFRHHVTHAM